MNQSFNYQQGGGVPTASPLINNMWECPILSHSWSQDGTKSYIGDASFKVTLFDIQTKNKTQVGNHNGPVGDVVAN